MVKFKAFTLSEVLVTLLLVGVIAALTLPFFIDSFQKTKWTLAYKRSFSETFNALTRLALEEDCAKSLTCTHVFEGSQENSTETFGRELTKIMSTKNNCAMSDGSCFSHRVKVGLSGAVEQKLMDTLKESVDLHKDLTNFYTFETNRGVSYAVFSFGLNCLNVVSANDDDQLIIKSYYDAYVYDLDETDNQMKNLCGFVIIDVNAGNPPNTWGRDVFGLWVTDRNSLGLYPFGGDYDNKFRGKCNVGANQDTRGCAAQLIKDGWKMTY